MTIRLPKASEMVASHLRRQIVLGKLKEGDRLPRENVLMEKFGVARTTLREAFRILEAEGAITVHVGRSGARVHVPGTRVAAWHVGMVLQYRGTPLSDVYNARAILESAAARMAATRRTSADLACLQETLDLYRKSLEDPSGSFSAPANFHRLILEFSRSEALQVLTAMVTEVIRDGDRVHADSHDWHYDQELAEIELREHTRLVELIRQREGQQAEEAWRKHLSESAKIISGDRAVATVMELPS